MSHEGDGVGVTFDFRLSLFDLIPEPSFFPGINRACKANFHESDFRAAPGPAARAHSHSEVWPFRRVDRARKARITRTLAIRLVGEFLTRPAWPTGLGYGRFVDREISQSMDDSDSERHIADNLIAALKAGEFVLYSQAIKPIGSKPGKSSYQEILIRYAEEEDKLLPPGGFFPTLERLKLMAMLDRWVVSRVVRWYTEKKKPDEPSGAAHCTINLSTDAILSKDFPGFVGKQLKAGKVPSGGLLFEISEHDADKLPLELDGLMLVLRPLGCRFVITGYGGEIISAEMLQALGVDLVKIDGRIVRRLHEDEQSLATATSIHGACREIGIQTIAELVELPETLHKLKKIGVDYAQGYGIAKPGPLN